MDSETIIKVIDALVGSIEPYGSTHIDNERIENLRVLLEVMDEYIAEIDKVVKYRNRPEYSMREMGEMAYDWFVDLKGYVDEFMKEYGEQENAEVSD